jgi:surface protein
MTIIDNSNVRDLVNAYINNRQSLPTDLDVPIGDWDVSRVTDMSELFENKSNFNENINNWDVSNVQNMDGMFSEATSFNQPLNNWDVSNVQGMNSMFSEATSFNQPLENWNVSNVERMAGMFLGATSFNQPLNNWDVSNVQDMPEMFYRATSFNQRLDNWDVRNVRDMINMLRDAAIQELPEWYEEEYSEEEEEELNEEQLANRRARQLATQRAAEERARAADTRDYPECVICGNYLNNVDGPDPTDKCRSKCEDVINVCINNHLFHRACILNSCNAGRVNIVSQMNIQGRGAYNVQQSIATKCPMCRSPLVPSCEGMRKKKRVVIANIGMDGMEINLIGGTRKTRKHKRGRKHKKTNKHRKHKRATKHKKHNTHRKGKKNNRKTRKH